MARPLYYAGIGSRRTPPEVLDFMRRVAARLAAHGFVLRSGAADGADAAFETGCVEAGGKAEIWLPWPGFNNHADTGFQPAAVHAEMAAQVHPAWERLSRGPRALHSRNVGQVLGADVATPVSFVLCWTPDGCETEATRTRDTGGTGTAIVLANRCGIPVFNLANADARDRLAHCVRTLLDGGAPSVITAEVEPGINIWSGAKGLGGALTNMSERAREKGCIKHSYPVTVIGHCFADSEAAYQALKIPGEVEYNDGLMIDLICLKFLQNPKLLELVKQKGGVPWLGRCSHLTQAKSERFQAWEGQGISSRFIRNLMHGYQKALSGEGPQTRVVHVKQAPFDVYIGRRNGDLPESIWHNPFTIGPDGSREEVVAKFAAYAPTRPELMAQVSALQGKTLGCWCKTKDTPHELCHGDVLRALAEGRVWAPPEKIQQTLF